VKKILTVFAILFIIVIGTFAYSNTRADGTYSSLGTTDASDGSNDAINFSQGKVWTIDQYGKYIWTTQTRNSTVTHWAWSNDNGANWSQSSESYSFLTRASVAYDSINDVLHVIWAATDTNDGIIYRRYGITRDGSNNITAIARINNGVNLQLDTSSSRSLDLPVALWVNDGSTDGSLVAIWPKHGTGINEVRASMRRLSMSDADGVAGNWVALDGTSDTFSTDPPAVAGDKIYSDSSGTNALSAKIRGGSGSRKDDLYVFVAEQDDSVSDTILAYRGIWDSVDKDWSGGWQSPVTLATVDTSSGYTLKYQLITKPVIDITNDRLYVGWAHWKDGVNGDTVSFGYLNSTDTASTPVDVYSALGTHSYAPTVDISYDDKQDYIYVSYIQSTTNGGNGHIDYKTYDGTTLSSATRFYTSPGGSGGADGSADIPILYETRSSNDRLLVGFRINGALPPTGGNPHTIYWGYVSLPTQPTIQFTSTSASGAESVTSPTLPISISGSFTRDVTVNYSVTGGTASGSGTDYTLSSGTATITAGSTSTTIPVTVVDDASDETDETIIVTLSSPNFASLGSNTSYTYTITDNDEASTNTSSSSNSSNSSAVSPPICSNSKPENTPTLYAATAEDTTTIKLYFADDSLNVDNYFIEYGLSSGSYIYSADNIGGKGARTYQIKSLSPNTTYYFRIANKNGCAVGSWSQEISAKTNSSQNNLQISNITGSSPAATSVPTIIQSPNPTTVSPTTTPLPAVKGYQVKIKVVDDSKSPVNNAKVTLHSTPRIAYTDVLGIATFDNVENGQHKVQVAYDNYLGEQNLTLEGDVKEFNINIEIKKVDSPQTNIMIYVGAAIILVLILIIIKIKKRKQ
jgi:hypothetical protein